MDKSKHVWKTSLFQYPLDLKVVFSHGIDGYDKKISGLVSQDEDARELTMSIDIDFDEDEIKLSILHECVHVKRFVEDSIGGKLDDESEAYFIQQLYDNVMHAWSKIQKKVDNR